MFKTVHIISVILFLTIYLFKTILLLANKNEQLAKFTKGVKVPEMIVSTLFLVTGIYLLIQMGTTTLLIIKIVMVLLSIPLAIIGFKKQNKLLACLATLMIIGAYGLAEMNHMKMGKQNIDPAVANTDSTNYNITKHGQAIFEAQCMKCHGKGGTNGVAADLTLSQMAADAKVSRIKNGGEGMAPFKDVLSDKEVGAVVAYVESLRK